MNPVACIVFLAFVAVATAAPQPLQGQPEDPNPIDTVTTCGGFVETSSASIEFQVGGSIRADMRCVWIIRGPYVSQRFNLVQSGLKETDGLFLSGHSRSGITAQQKLATVGQNITINSRTAILTLSVGHAPTLGFKLEFFSSGSSENSVLSGHALLTTAKGNYTYPVNGGQYGNNENALFAIAPTVPGQPTLRFTRVNLENDSGCTYDSIRVYNWFDNDYLQVVRFCGTTIPTSVTFQDGAGLVAFVTDSSVTSTGFEFQYE
ncbi:exoskeleton protein RP43 [Folsomia candida]|uniref:Cubilin n=1 Tax=Folsomia candida TaxID=158441 RepID=A0A226F0F3_FOLCA|nr:exoskeleton protein RP43 [Folsomia candida]OXA62870.1 Cubilin [Folsomia candida]